MDIKAYKKPLVAFIVLVLTTLFGANYSFADENRVVVVVHPSQMETLSRQELYQLYFGKKLRTSGTKQLVPIVIEHDDVLLKQFARAFLQRNASQLRSQWARQLFTGRGSPPKMVRNSEFVKSLVAANPKYIGFIREADVDDTVRILVVDGPT